MRRALVSLLALSVVALAVPGAASATDAVEQARDEVAQARVGIDRAVEAAEADHRERGYDLARSAYLDDFERAEPPLRLRDANLVLDLEFKFAELRDGIRDGAPLSEIRATATELRRGLNDVDRELADKGFAAPLLAFSFSFTILFREGIEAVLIIAVLLGSLEAGRAAGFRKPLAW